MSCSRDIDSLNSEFRDVLMQVIAKCEEINANIKPYCLLRPGEEQARLWRQTRTTAQIQATISRLRNARAVYIADLIEGVGPQSPPPGTTGHITNAVPGQSWHQFGLAADCYRIVGGSISWRRKHYKAYADVARSFGLTAGYDWGWDSTHVQLPGKENPLDLYGSWEALSEELEEREQGRFG